MYELIQVGPQSYYIQSPVKIGVYVQENGDAFLIDSGSDKNAAKKVLRHIESQGWRLKGILPTHGHADHTGGCAYLQNKTDCKIFSDGLNAAFIQWPELSPAYLYGGNPCKALRHKFLMAEAAHEVVELTDPDYPIGLVPVGLCGHSFLQTGYYTPDGTVFLADCLNSEATLEKYGVCFLYHVGRYLETLDYVAEMRERSGLKINWFVPAHADATDDIEPLARKNKEKVLEVADYLVHLCESPINLDEILKQVFDHYGLTMNFEQHALVGSTVRSYLSWLYDQGRVEAVFEDNVMLWKQTEASKQ